MEQIPLNGLVAALFAGYKAAKDERKPNLDRKFNELKVTPFLFDSAELDDLLDHARDKEDHETILDHMYRMNADAPSYDRVEKKIIDKYWGE